MSEAIYWDEDHKEYPFGRSSNRYRVDPETLRLYQVPEYDAPTIEASIVGASYSGT